MEQQNAVWKQHFAEEMMSDLNIIDEQILGKVRATLYVVYDFKHVWIKYDLNKQMLEVLVTFRWYRNLFGRNKVVTTIVTALHEKFPNLDIEVRSIDYDERER